MTKQPLIAGSDDCVGAHTPGPWAVQLSPGRGVLSVTSETTWICGELQAENATAIDRRECEANALLIAAAPDLLEACKAAEEWLSGWASAEPYLETIRAAITSATGSQS